MGPGSRALFLLHCIALAPPLSPSARALAASALIPAPKYLAPVISLGRAGRHGLHRGATPDPHYHVVLGMSRGAGAAGCEVNCSVFHVAHYWGTEA